MILFEELFSDPATLSREWLLAPGMAVSNGVLTFSPDHEAGYCAGLTRRDNFSDFTLSADVRIVCGAVGLVLRAQTPHQYYMVQFDIDNDPSMVWFHTFTPSAENGYRVELVPGARVPALGAWHRMAVIARGEAFDVLLGPTEGPLQHCASWRDPHCTYRRGAVGLWEHGGEAGEYRRLRVEALPQVDA
jgi:hypothetical protein